MGKIDIEITLFPKLGSKTNPLKDNKTFYEIDENLRSSYEEQYQRYALNQKFMVGTITTTFLTGYSAFISFATGASLPCTIFASIATLVGGVTAVVNLYSYDKEKEKALGIEEECRMAISKREEEKELEEYLMHGEDLAG